MLDTRIHYISNSDELEFQTLANCTDLVSNHFVTLGERETAPASLWRIGAAGGPQALGHLPRHQEENHQGQDQTDTLYHRTRLDWRLSLINKNQ